MGEVRVGVSGWRYPAGAATSTRRAGAAPRAGVRRVPDELGRAERLVLLAAASVDLRSRSSSRPPTTSRSRSRAAATSRTCCGSPAWSSTGQLLRLGRPGARRAARAGAVAAAAGLAYDERRLAAFLDLLPRTTRAAAQLAAQHDDKLSGDRVLTECAVDLPIRHALEARHPSFGPPAAVSAARASTTSRWSPRTAPVPGRTSRSAPRASCTCGCTATPSSTPAATPPPPWIAGRRRPRAGAQRASMSTSTSTTTPAGGRLTTRSRLLGRLG